MSNSFKTRTILTVGNLEHVIFSLGALEAKYRVSRLPFAHKVLLENLLRHEDGATVTRADIEALLHWDPAGKPDTEIAFTPARVLMQDFTGVPAVVDLAAMREAMAALGGEPAGIDPQIPAELVIDHSVQVDHYATPQALRQNHALELQRNRERYQFLRWGQQAFANLAVVPPGTGIVHQVNIEHLARVVFTAGGLAYPDTLVGMDSHTTMVNSLGVLGWGVGGIGAEAAMLGQSVTMLIPQVVGVKLSGSLSPVATATDLVLKVTELLREYGVVGKFVEFFGEGLGSLALADRATLSNMAPEFGSTCAMFPIDAETLRYLALSGRSETHCALIRHYAQAQGLWREEGATPPDFTDVLELDLGKVGAALAGPRRPQDRIGLDHVKSTFRALLPECLDRPAKGGEPADAADTDPQTRAQGPVDEAGAESFPSSDPPAVAGSTSKDAPHRPIARSWQAAGRATHPVRIQVPGAGTFELDHGAVVIAAITSCTNTSNPAVMVAAGLLARNAAARGLKVQPWVKTSLAPGSKVVHDYLQACNLLADLQTLGFDIVGYGCTTCIGNSGPLGAEVARAIREQHLVCCSVLSGNRNFEGRIHPDVTMNFLASPPLVVAYALAGSIDINLHEEPLGQGSTGPVYLNEVWPDPAEVQALIEQHISTTLFRRAYRDVFRGDAGWLALQTPAGSLYHWPDSTYVKKPPYFDGLDLRPPGLADFAGARVLVLLGDSVTTDHISPAGTINPDSPAGRYLLECGVAAGELNSYGSRRGNHEVMMRGTFANPRLRNLLVPGTAGGMTLHLPGASQMSIFEAAMRYRDSATPLLIIAGKEYGTGSSRDWAAKGPLLLGVRAVLAGSYERIHRANLIGMGIVPLQFMAGENARMLDLTGREEYRVSGLDNGSADTVTVEATNDKGEVTRFRALVRLDTPREVDYIQHGGILHYVLRELAAKHAA